MGWFNRLEKYTLETVQIIRVVAMRPGIFQMTAKDAASTPIQIEIDNLPVITGLECKQIKLILKSFLNVGQPGEGFFDPFCR